MNREPQSVEPPAGITTLDLLLFTAGFAFGWVMHRASALHTGRIYLLPVMQSSALLNRQFWVLSFQSHLRMVWVGWLWAFVIGLAFLVLGRRFRCDCRKRWAECLAVALAIVLFESVWPQMGESWAELWWMATRLAAGAAVIAIVAWRFRAKLSQGWVAVLVFVIAVLVTLGPIRLAEATSVDATSSAPHPLILPGAGEKPWSRPWVAAYFEVHVWAGYSIRAAALMTLAILTARSLLTRARRWLWTEWAALAATSMIAGCWL